MAFINTNPRIILISSKHRAIKSLSNRKTQPALRHEKHCIFFWGIVSRKATFTMEDGTIIKTVIKIQKNKNDNNNNKIIPSPH